jgi:pimeloyl-[acyl-carrier protein] methyl ester esterase
LFVLVRKIEEDRMRQMSHESLEVVAMHGWAGDARCWEPWQAATRPAGWIWELGERGYGALEPRIPSWSDQIEPNGRRLVIGHSLGPHFLPADLWSRADAVVLLASFGAFVPPDRPGRRVRAALAAMTAKMHEPNTAREMMRQFLANAADPEQAELLPQGPNNDETLNLARLRQDLDLLAKCEGLPAGFPQAARVLIIEAACDKIVSPEARTMLRSSLPAADFVRLDGAGHALLRTDVLQMVVGWAQSWR